MTTPTTATPSPTAPSRSSSTRTPAATPATPAAIAAAFYEAYLADDVAGASVLLAPDAVLHVPGSNPVAGDHVGLDGILGFILSTNAITAEGRVTTRLVDLTGGADHATAICEVVGERPDRDTMHNRTVHVLRVADGRIAEIWFHNWDQPSVDAFWS